MTISGGTRFYLTAPLTQTKDVSGSWSVKAQGSITKDYSAYKITTGSGTQDLALVFGEGVEDEKYVSFSVKWLELAKVGGNQGGFQPLGCKAGWSSVWYSTVTRTVQKLITEMPATD